MPDALQLLRDDHKKVKELFKQFAETEDRLTRGAIVDEALKELLIHAELEEEIFYPAMRRETGVEGDQMDEADEEHHVAKVLIAELQKMRPTSSHFDAKFTVLAENVKHHIDEEESEMLPRAAELGMGRMDELGMEMERRKLQLMKNGMPRTSAASRGRSTSTSRRRATTAESRNGSTPRTAGSTSRARPRATATTGSATSRSTKTATSSRTTTGRSTSRRATSKARARSASRARR